MLFPDFPFKSSQKHISHPTRYLRFRCRSRPHPKPTDESFLKDIMVSFKNLSFYHFDMQRRIKRIYRHHNTVVFYHRLALRIFLGRFETGVNNGMSRVDRFLPILQVDVCFLCLLPGFPGVQHYITTLYPLARFSTNRILQTLPGALRTCFATSEYIKREVVCQEKNTEKNTGCP